ncbi:MAG: YHS domain-containing protein [Acidobacteriota bacterium]|nr:YHS domain-containing protein [Blastocatellia bacterium]MDW8239746.1 YHS domain-containing protein [Acidobacteriota bacterium]
MVALGSSEPHHNTSGQRVIDPVCGMSVDPATAAASYDYRGGTYFFCCTHCLEKFRAEPDKYLASPRQHLSGVASDTIQPQRADTSVEYTYPVHPPEVRQQGRRRVPPVAWHWSH